LESKEKININHRRNRSQQKMRIEFEPSRMKPCENAQFNPIKNAHQTVEVFVDKCRLKMQIKREPYQAQEIIEGRI
jgi:hypothetical protein